MMPSLSSRFTSSSIKAESSRLTKEDVCRKNQALITKSHSMQHGGKTTTTRIAGSYIRTNLTTYTLHELSQN